MDVYDQLTTKRSYKNALSAFVKLIIMKKMSIDFHPKLLNSFIGLMSPDLESTFSVLLII